jgi:UDP-galactopyranose mutase
VDLKFTRIVEHKHFNQSFQNLPHTIITKEYPSVYKRSDIPYYPIENVKNRDLYNKYLDMAEHKCPNMILGGRLAEYRYYDMHQVVGGAIAKAREELFTCQLK